MFEPDVSFITACAVRTVVAFTHAHRLNTKSISHGVSSVPFPYLEQQQPDSIALLPSLFDTKSRADRGRGGVEVLLLCPRRSYVGVKTFVHPPPRRDGMRTANFFARMCMCVVASLFRRVTRSAELTVCCSRCPSVVQAHAPRHRLSFFFFRHGAGPLRYSGWGSKQRCSEA